MLVDGLNLILLNPKSELISPPNNTSMCYQECGNHLFSLWVSGEDWRAEDIIISKLYWFVDLFALSLRKSEGKEHGWGWLTRKTIYRVKESKTCLERQKLNKCLILMWLDVFVLYFFNVFEFPISISVIPRSRSEETVYITVSSFSFWISDRYSVVEIITQKLQHQFLSLSALVFRYLPVYSSTLFFLGLYSTIL